MNYLSRYKHHLLIFMASVLIISACVSNKAVQTVQAGDDRKSCDVLKTELTQLGAKFEDTKEDSGVTGKNVGLAIFFWPGIIVNEVRANKNQDSIDSRISHLSTIYNEKCINEEQGSLKEKLIELKSLHDQGLLNDEEYERARKRAIDIQ